MQQTILGLGVVFEVGCLAWGIGAIVLRILRLRLDSLSEFIVCSIALGLGAISYIILGFGLAGHLRLGILISTLFGVACLAITMSSTKRRDLSWLRGIGSLSKVIVALVIAAVILTWIGSMAPPVSDDWDSIAYHLADAKVYLQHDRIMPLWYESHSNFPMTIEMLYAFGMDQPDTGTAAAKGMHWLMYLLTISGTFMLARRFFRHGDEDERFPPAALFCAFVFATVPMVLWEATSAYIDIGTALFLTLAVHMGFTWRDKREARYAILSGVFAGFAMGTKYTIILYAVVFGLILLYDGFKDWIGGRKAISNVAIYGLVALAIASPWYIKSYVWTRNPVYPFFYSVFDGKNWNAHNARVYEESQKAFGMGRSIDKLVLSPINLTLKPSAFNDRMSADWKVIYLFSIGPIFLMAIPCLLAARGAPRELWYLIVLLAAAWIAWFVQMQYARYLIALAPLASVVAGWLIWNLWERFRSVAVIPVVATVLIGAFNVGLFAMMIAIPRAPVVFGMQSRDDYLTQNLGGLYTVSQYINETLPKDAKIIMYQEVRGFYINRDYLWGNPEHHDMIPYETFKTPDDLLNGLRKIGVTHVLTFDPAMPSYDQAGGWVRLLYDAAIEQRVRVVYAERGYTLMEIPPR